MYVTNPNAAKGAGRGEAPAPVPTEERAALAEAVARLVAEWPAADELGEAIPLISLHELTAAIRRAGVVAASVEGVAEAVRELGLASG